MLDFSVVIPTYNGLTLLKRALESVINQKGITFEIIIVDDSSTNDISQYIESINHKEIKYFRNRNNLGAVKNWNYGLSLATAKYVVLLHHDECFHDSTYQLSKYLSKFLKQYDIVVTNLVVLFSNGIRRNLSFSPILKLFVLNRLPSFLFMANIIGPVSCIAFRRELYNPFDSTLNWFVDVEWYYRLLKNQRVYYFKELYIDSLHGHSVQISQNIDIKKTSEMDVNTIKSKYSSGTSVRFFLWIYSNTMNLKNRMPSKFNFIWKTQ